MRLPALATIRPPIDEDRDQDEQAVAEPDGVAERADGRQHQEAGQDEEGADGEADRAHPGRDGQGERGQHAGADDGERGVDAGVADEGQRDVGRQREQHGEAGGDHGGHRQHAEDEADAAPGQPGGDDRADGEAQEVEELDRRDEVGALHGIEVERLLVLQRGEGGEAGDGGGQERQRDEDPPQHADLPDRAPGLAERGRGLDGDVEGASVAVATAGSPGRCGQVVERGGLAALRGQHLLGSARAARDGRARARAGAGR